MFVSIIFVILFLIGLVEILLYPKCNGKLNAIKVIVMGTMAILCYQVLSAFVCSKLHIDVNIRTTLVAVLMLDFVLGIGILYKHRIQKLFIRLIDIVNIIFIIIFILFISNHIFSINLELQYLNGDAASHFLEAMYVVRMEDIKNIYFSAYLDALFIELLMPILSATQYYKAFILSDIFMHVLEVLMFYTLAITISDKKSVSYMGTVLSLAYFWGYPMYSYMEGNFVYWSNGVMILIFIIYALFLLEKYPKMRKYNGTLFLLGAYANTCCNKLFIPLNTLAIFITLIVVFWPYRRKIIYSKSVIGIGAVALIGIFIFYVKVWGSTLQNLVNVVSGVGGIYCAMYADLIFFLPPFFLLSYFIKTKKNLSKIIWVISLYMFSCTVGMYVLWYNFIMSTYYYYKIYYNLWLMGWLVSIAVLDIMEENKQLVAACSYIGMITVAAFIAISNYDTKMSADNEIYNANYATSKLFSIYGYNRNLLAKNYEEKRVSGKLLDVYNYVIEQCQGEVIPMVLSDYIDMIWYDALTGMYSEGYRMDTYGFSEILPLLDAAEVRHIIVTKNDRSYEKYQEYFEKCIVVYGNDDAAVLSPSGTSWCDLSSIVPDYSKEKIEIFSYVINMLQGKQVPLLVSESAYIDSSMYYNVTGQSFDYSTWNFDVEELIDVLQENQIEYVVLLKEDIFFYENWSYFDNWEIIYENEAGLLVKNNSF